jgi:hypothetical protein
VGTGTADHVRAALAGLETARKPKGAALADTDLGEAVDAAVNQVLGGKPGLVWLFTNNRNSPNNDQQTFDRNREFYALIHRGPAIVKALAFPLRMPVKGAHYRANGLMVYVFAVGAEGARALDAAAGRGPRQARDHRAAGAPETAGPRYRAPGAAQGRGCARRGILDRHHRHGARRRRARRPRTLRHRALEPGEHDLSLHDRRRDARRALGAGRRKPPHRAGAHGDVKQLAPGKAEPLASSMQLPVGRLPGTWSIEALKSAGSAYVLPGRIELRLDGQRLVLSQGFRERMAALFPGDPLPEIFTPPAEIQASTAALPIEVRVHYGAGPLSR